MEKTDGVGLPRRDIARVFILEAEQGMGNEDGVRRRGSLP